MSFFPLQNNWKQMLCQTPGCELTQEDLGLVNKMDIPTGNTAEYIRGDGTLGTFPDIPAAQIQSDWIQTDPESLDFIKNKPNVNTKVFSYTPRELDTIFQLSTTRDCFVSYSVDVSATLPSIGTIILEIADNSGFSTNVQTICSTANGNSGLLSIGSSLTQVYTSPLAGIIPANKYVRLRTVNIAGSPVFTFSSSQEVQL